MSSMMTPFYQNRLFAEVSEYIQILFGSHHLFFAKGTAVESKLLDHSTQPNNQPISLQI